MLVVFSFVVDIKIIFRYNFAAPENPAIFKILAKYLGPEASEPVLFRQMQAYSDTFNNDSYNNINF